MVIGQLNIIMVEKETWPQSPTSHKINSRQNVYLIMQDKTMEILEDNRREYVQNISRKDFLKHDRAMAGDTVQ